MRDKISNPDEFLRGQQDCQEGIEHKTGRSDDYDRGFSAQYQMQEAMTYKQGGF